MKSHHETEIKLEVSDARALKRRLAELKFRVANPRHFESNRLYDFPDHRLRNEGCVLRLRSVGRKCLLTFKGPSLASPHYKIRTEIETLIEDGDRLDQIFERLALKQLFRYDKYRTVYRQHGDKTEGSSPELCYDETPIGDFVELEGPARWIDGIARQLGYSRRQYIKRSYVTLYLQHCEARAVQPGDMIFPDRKS